MNQELLAGLSVICKDAPDTSNMEFTTTTNGVNMKNYENVVACLIVTDAGTGSVVTMKQGTTSTVNTALTFTKYFYIADISAGTTLTEGTASSNTFTTGTGSKTGLYMVPVRGDMLDKTQESEDSYVRMNCASATSAVGAMFYLCWKPRFSGDPTAMPSVA